MGRLKKTGLLSTIASLGILSCAQPHSSRLYPTSLPSLSDEEIYQDKSEEGHVKGGPRVYGIENNEPIFETYSPKKIPISLKNYHLINGNIHFPQSWPSKKIKIDAVSVEDNSKKSYPFTTNIEKMLNENYIRNYENWNSLPFDFRGLDKRTVDYVHTPKSPYRSPFLGQGEVEFEEEIPISKLAKVVWDAIVRKGKGPVFGTIRSLDNRANEIATSPISWFLPENVKKRIRVRASQSSLGARLQLSGESNSFNLEYRIDKGSSNLGSLEGQAGGRTISLSMVHTF